MLATVGEFSVDPEKKMSVHFQMSLQKHEPFRQKGIIPVDKRRSGPSSLGPSLGPTALLRLRLKQHKNINATRTNVNTAVEATAMISFIKTSSFFSRGGGGGPGTL